MSTTAPDTAPTPADRPPVDPGFAPLLALLADPSIPPMSTQAPADAREAYRNLRSAEGELAPVRSVADRVVPGPAGDVPVRIVVPEVAAPVGVLVWFHGGGWVLGDLDTAEGTQRRLAAAAGCVVVSVDYRLAPEAPAPAGFDDCWAATTWVAAHRDELGSAGLPIAVGGDSAGGNLAALVALRAAAEGGPDLALQLLAYPVTDLTGSHPSYEENAEGYFLTADTMRWFIGHHLAGGLASDDPAVSPLFAPADAVAGVAPALTLVAGYDPLRDEGRAYAEKLVAAGVASELIEYPTMIHGFLGLATFTAVSDQALADAADALRRAFAG